MAYRCLLAVFWVGAARWAVPEVVGELAIANAVAVPVFVGLDAGVNQYLVREYRVGSGLPAHLRRVVAWRGPLVGAGVALSTLGTHLLGGGDTAALTGLLVGGGYAIDFMCQAWLSPDRAALNMAPDRLMKVLQGAGSLASLGLLRALGSVSAPSIALGVLVAYLLAGMNPWYRWSRSPVFEEWPALHGSDRPGTWRPLVLFGVAGVVPAIYTRLDDVAVQLARGTAALAGYSLAYKLIESARLPAWAISRVVLATASSGVTPDAPIHAARAIHLSVALALVAALACSAAGPAVAGMAFGSAYAHVGPVLKILSISVLVAGFTGPAQGFLLGAGRERAAVVASLSTLGVMALGLVVFTPRYGVRGAAWCVVAAELVNAALLLRACALEDVPLRLAWMVTASGVGALVLTIGALHGQ